MNIKCTKVLLDKLKLKPEELKKDSVETNEFDNWYANIIKFWRFNTVLLTHEQSLFSFFIWSYRADDFKNFDKRLREDIFKLMFNQNLDQKIIDIVIDSMESITYWKTDSKVVLWNMKQIKFYVEDFVCDWEDILFINKNINDLLFRTLKGTPHETFMKLLEDKNAN